MNSAPDPDADPSARWPQRARSSRYSRVGVVALAALVALLHGGVISAWAGSAWSVVAGRVGASSPAQQPNAGGQASSSAALLDRFAGTQAARVATPNLPAADYRRLRGKADQYRFITEGPNQAGAQVPARWNPCQPIAYRINPGQMQSADVAEVREAIARLGQASGLSFTYLGLTDYVWTSQENPSAVPSDATLTFSFALAGKGDGRSDLLGSPRVVGVGGPVWQTTQGGQRIVAAHVVINSEVVLTLPRGRGPGSRLNAYLHELGHAVGLDHVTSRAQLMYPTLQSNLPPVFGAGDVAGLRQVGAAAGCLP